MGISNQEQILVPSKFIALMLHLIVTTMNYFSYPDNILSAYPSVTSRTDTLYQGGKTSFLAANTLVIIFLAAEFVILLIGVNMFKQKHSLLTSTLHYFGAILGAAFTFGYWQFDTMWALWFLFSFIPLTSQIFMIITAPKRA